MRKPVMSPAVESDVLDALTMFQDRNKWNDWGLNTLREQGPCILLHGPTGTGKTVIAKWMAQQIGKGFKQLKIAAIPGGEPGAHEKAIEDFFDDCEKRKNATVFIDECDHLLGDRTEISADGRTWQLGGTETLMMRMNIYRGLVICATNLLGMLDPAVASRFIAMIHVGVPDFKCRMQLWKVKIPRKFPFRPNTLDLKTLAKHELTGRQIENIIWACGQFCIRKKLRPKLNHLEMFCEREKTKIIEK